MLFMNGAFAQNAEYSIVVKDIETQLPIENAIVVILKTNQVLLSNEEGKVTFVVNGASNVEVSEINYENLSIRWNSLKENDFIVYLKSKDNKLDEIVLSNENPQKILQKIVSNSAKKITDSYRLKVYVREFFMLNNQYSYYNDGLVNFQFTGKAPPTLLVEQNRSYGLLETDISADLRGYDLNNIMHNYCTFKYFEILFDPKAKKEYDFMIRAHDKNKDYYVMSIKPLDDAKEALENFEIIYDPEKRLIFAFTIDFPPISRNKIKENTAINSKNITRSFVKVDYRLDGENYYLLSSNEEIAYDLILKDKITNIQVRNNFITTSFNKQKFTYNKSDVFKEKTLFNKKNKVLTNYWDISGFTATEEEKAIINALEFRL